MQPKKYKNPKIALLNVELELKAEKDNAEIRVHTVEVGFPSGDAFWVRALVCRLLSYVSQVPGDTSMSALLEEKIRSTNFLFVLLK